MNRFENAALQPHYPHFIIQWPCITNSYSVVEQKYRRGPCWDPRQFYWTVLIQRQRTKREVWTDLGYHLPPEFRE